MKNYIKTMAKEKINAILRNYLVSLLLKENE